ncbi:HNH endonuclease [Tritonibacter horizontis]|uniref:HNH nuclease domain-containing protein n=1 Tax=Tritonibacter horizontis TaxID=1768241 RepID=A0A132BX50_9RHOB|nr:HNH endonuclease [Tritonibacter horizontis]KUP92874.1 hypothetical protein TRIHO_23250 [Tritonibacter horizontis]
MPEMTEQEAQYFVEQVLDQDERSAINVALASQNPWKHESFNDPVKTNLGTVKVKIKNFHFERVSRKCCYCRRSLEDASIETDREHIVPKGKKKSLSYDIFNLSLACKRCNMTYKGEKVDHIVDVDTIESDLRNPDRYLIPHPNIHSYEDHLIRISVQYGAQQFTSYRRITPQGQFLYDFVRLDKLCVDELDIAQGGKKVDEVVAQILDLPLDGI